MVIQTIYLPCSPSLFINQRPYSNSSFFYTIPSFATHLLSLPKPSNRKWQTKSMTHIRNHILFCHPLLVYQSQFPINFFLSPRPTDCLRISSRGSKRMKWFLYDQWWLTPKHYCSVLSTFRIRVLWGSLSHPPSSTNPQYQHHRWWLQHTTVLRI